MFSMNAVMSALAEVTQNQNKEAIQKVRAVLMEFEDSIKEHIKKTHEENQ